ncbi:unnamed protein product [Brassica oleracea]
MVFGLPLSRCEYVPQNLCGSGSSHLDWNLLDMTKLNMN